MARPPIIWWTVILLKVGHSRPLFIYFCLFNTVDSKQVNIFNINFADDWIWTADLWYWKQPLYQLSHNHFPNRHIVATLISFSLEGPRLEREHFYWENILVFGADFTCQILMPKSKSSRRKNLILCFCGASQFLPLAFCWLKLKREKILKVVLLNISQFENA